MAFAKLYGEDDDQILVMLNDEENGPEIRIYFQPSGLGLCFTSVEFPDTDEGWETAKKAFSAIDETRVRGTVAKIMAQIPGQIDG